MRQSTNLPEREMVKPTIPTDTAEIPKPSPRDQFLLELKLTGFILTVLSVIWLGVMWGLYYFQSH
jgi:hypothetical protein